MGDLQEELRKKLGATEVAKQERKVDWEAERKKYDRPPKKNYGGRGGSYNDRRGSDYHAPGHSPRNNTARPTTQVATAPYNFIALPKVMMPSALNARIDVAGDEKKRSAAYKAYILEKGTYSGIIDLDITTLTPCFIGGNGEEFYGPTGEPILPGSTLRGMTKNIFKIITCGAMRGGEDFTDRHLYFRCMMAPNRMPQLKKLHDYYVSRMTTTNRDGDVIKTNKPGFLVRKQGKYYICPAEMTSIRRSEYGYVGKDSKVDWNIREKKAYCLTGNQRNKEYIRCLSHGDWNTLYEIPESIIQDYRDDKNRRGVNLLDDKNSQKNGSAVAFTGCADIDRVVPCFYIREHDTIQSFGHGRSYRIPYRKTVGANIPKALQDEGIIDFADAVFGRKELWGSRVFFEDAHLTNGVRTEKACAIKPLMGPNPTSFQLYLKQQKGEFPDHWDEASEIRGYKMYWHQNITDEWKDTQPFTKEREKITHRIKVLGKNASFHGRIRFENLSDIELGALLHVFRLTKDSQKIAYKLGQGKSVGLGSVTIKAELQLFDDKKYTSLFNDGGWETALVPATTDTYIDAYYKSLGEYTRAYENSLTDLVHVLDWTNTAKAGWKQKVASMSNDVQTGDVDRRYVERALLPTIEEIIKK